MERKLWIDNAKGIGIILVVIGHAIGYVVSDNVVWHIFNKAIYTFHMPLFFFLSAILQRQYEVKKKDAYSNETIKRKIVSVGIPYLLFSLIYFGVKVLMRGVVNNQVEISDLLMIPVVPLSTLWFIYSLLIFWLLRVVVVKLKVSHKWILAGCVLLHMINAYINYSSLIGNSIIPRLMKNAVFYAIGIEMGGEDDKKPSPIWAIGWICLFIADCLWKVSFWTRGLYSLIIGLCGVLAVVYVSKKKTLLILTKIGRDSLGVYLLHDYVVCFVVIFAENLHVGDSLAIPIASVFGVVIPYEFYLICMKNKVLRCLFNPYEICKLNRKLEKSDEF